MDDIRHIVMFSGGVGSWAAAKRVVAEHGTEHVVLLFADTLIEDEDLHRFLEDAAIDIGVPITKIADGRDVWQVFYDQRFLGNTRVDICSRILKREQCEKWLKQNCDPADTTLYLGLDWTEHHRYDRAASRWKPWVVKAPMCEPPYLTKQDVLNELRGTGIEPPRLYSLGFPHNNCGGGCVKAGQAHWAHLLKVMPERYAWWEQKEREFRKFIGQDVSILRDFKGGKTKPMTLQTLRERIESRPEQVDLFDWGGCGCFGFDEDENGYPAAQPSIT